jgi:hypothetical protein
LPGFNASSDDLNTDVSAGRWTILVEISDYNGLPDDDQITIALYTTSGHKTDPEHPGLADDACVGWERRLDATRRLGGFGRRSLGLHRQRLRP